MTRPRATLAPRLERPRSLRLCTRRYGLSGTDLSVPLVTRTELFWTERLTTFVCRADAPARILRSPGRALESLLISLRSWFDLPAPITRHLIQPPRRKPSKRL